MTSRLLLQRSALIGLLVALLAGIWLAALGFTVWRLREEALSTGMDKAVTHVRNFEEHLTQTLQVIELTAGSINPDPAGRVDYADIGRRLATALRPAPFLRSISLADDTGRIVASSNPVNLGVAVDLAGFYPLAGPSANVVRIGMPWRGRDFGGGRASDGRAPLEADAPNFIAVLRGLPAQHETVWLVAALNPDYFSAHGAHLLPAAEGRVQWLRYDGILLASTAPQDPVGVAGAAGQVVERLAQRENGELSQVLPDGSAVLTAYRASSRFPVVVAVHMDRARALAAWNLEARRLVSIVIPVLLALGAVSFVVWRRQHRIAGQQAELEAQRQLAASVFDASTESIIITSPDAAILSVNPAFERITGYSAAEVAGRNPRLLASGMQDTEFYRRMWSALLRDGVWSGELVNRRKDGRLVTVLATINAVHDAEGTLLHYVGISTDIGERKRYEAELLDARDRAEAAAMAKTHFLATMSHEIRTPMNGVLGMTELMLLGELSAEQRDQLQVIRNSGDALLTILNDILDFAKIEAQGVSLEAVPFDPVEVLNDLVGLYGNHAAAKLLRLQQSIDNRLPATVIGDPTRLRQVLGNLLSNAIKFTHAGGITVSVAPEGPPDDGGEAADTVVLRFEVADSGIGIPAEKQAAIFDSFTQADSTITRRYGGTGLGLAISRRLAEAMGGSLSVSSQPGTGSCFTLRIRVHVDAVLAAERDAQPGSVVAGAASLVLARPLRILAAEDTPTNQIILRSMLGKLGHEVRLVADGAEACAAFAEGEFDLILMDMQMPVMGGLEATRAIRRHEATHGGHVPIIALTANAFAQDREACLAAGMDGYLAKPVKLSELDAVLRERAVPA